MKRALLALFAAVLLGATPARISIDVRDADVADVLALLAAQSGVNIVADASIKAQRVSLHLQNVTFDAALRVLTESHDLSVRRSAGVLIVGTAESMNRRYAQPGGPLASATAILNFARASADDVAKELTAALPEGTIVVPDKRSASVVVSGTPATIARAKMLAAALDVSQREGSNVQAKSYSLRFTKASAATATLKGFLADGTYAPDDAQNAILVTGNAALQQTAARLIASLDVPAPQVLFEVRVADIVPSSESSNIGVEFGGYDLAGQPTLGAASYAFARNSLAINARLNLMLSSGRAQILATPRLVTLNNKEADLLIGETYPVIFYDARAGGQQVQFVDVGVKLRLTPTIGSDGTIVAEMHPEYSAIQTFVGGYPVIANRKIDSTLRVGDNETIVLGGLLREIDSETITKVPWLSQIPVFGKLFQNRQHSAERDEVVFFITPHIMRPPKR